MSFIIGTEEVIEIATRNYSIGQRNGTLEGTKTKGVHSEQRSLNHWSSYPSLPRSWRVAILVPIWQNCESGHWKYGHPSKLAGRIVHYGMMLWAVGFFIFQVLQADAINTYQFAYGLEKKGIIQYLGWGEESQLWFELEYPYMRALVQMWVVYALMHVTGFTLYRIVLQKQKSDEDGMALGTQSILQHSDGDTRDLYCDSITPSPTMFPTVAPTAGPTL